MRARLTAIITAAAKRAAAKRAAASSYSMQGRTASVVGEGGGGGPTVEHLTGPTVEPLTGPMAEPLTGPMVEPLTVTPAMLLAAYAIHEEPHLQNHYMDKTEAAAAAALSTSAPAVWVGALASAGAARVSNGQAAESGASGVAVVLNSDFDGYFEAAGIPDALMTSLAKINVSKDVEWPLAPAERLAAERSLPRWIADIWVAELGLLQADALAQASNLPGPVYLRCNTLLCTRDELIVALKEEGVVAVPCTLSLWGVKVLSPAKPNIWGSPAWKRGLFEVQDEGSQLIALACTTDGRGHLPAGAVAVDTCAGRGGKTLCLAMASKPLQAAYSAPSSSRKSSGSSGGGSGGGSGGSGGGSAMVAVAATAVAFDVDTRALSDLGVRLVRSKAGDLCCVAQEPTVDAVARAVAAHRKVYLNVSGSSSARPAKRHKAKEAPAAVATSCLGDTVPLKDSADAGRQSSGAAKESASTSVNAGAAVGAVASAGVGEPAVEGADVVLVDAPCSRLGILRRGPGSRWELPNHADIPVTEGLPATQASLVAQGAALVAKGGILVYATCTVRNAENLDIVRQFEESECGAAFEPAPLVEAFGASLATAVMAPVIGSAGGAGASGSSAHEAEEVALTVNNAYCVTLMPHLHDTDGFFIARWRRKSK